MGFELKGLGVVTGPDTDGPEWGDNQVGVDNRWVRFTGLIKETGAGQAKLGDQRSLVP